MTDTLDAVAHATELNKQRAAAWSEGKRLLDDVAERKTPMTAEERVTWDRINADIDRLDGEREVYLTASRREDEAARIRESELSDLGERAVTNRDWNERKFVLDTVRTMSQSAVVGGPVLSIPVHRAMEEAQMIRRGLDPKEARAIAWDTGSIASGVPVTTARELYQYLEARIAMFRAPTRKFNTASGEQMHFPKLAAHAIATQVSGQGTTLAGTDPTFARMTMDAWKYGELVIVAEEVLQDNGFDFTSFILQDIARALGRKIDTDLAVGSGSGLPEGIMTGPAGAGTIATGGSLLTPSYENLVDLVYSVNDEYRASGAAGFLMKDATAGNIRKLRDGAGGTVGAVLWEPSLTAGIQNGQPDRLLGFPVFTDPNIASLASNNKIVGFGDFNAYYVRTVGPVDLARDDSRYFDTDQIGFRGKWRVDGDTIDKTASGNVGAWNLLKQSV